MPTTIAAVAAALGPSARRFDIDVLPSCDSTNAVLLARAERGAPSGTVVIAEEQTAGRGRRGRSWFASPDDSLTFSLLWRFAPGSAPTGLSLAVGVAVARALDEFGSAAPALPGNVPHGRQPAGRGQPIALKWPNDILHDGRKLGGILIELVPGAPHAAVIGIGVNLRLPVAMPEEVRAASAALCASGETADQNHLYALLLGELLATLELFGTQGFAAIRPDWMARHAWQDARVNLLSDFGPPAEGICRGVDSSGALLLEVDGRVDRVLSGEVSLRPA